VIRGKVVRLPGGIVVRWPDEPEDELEAARLARERRCAVLEKARAARILPIAGGGRRLH
jgi:hypothetical protein